MPILASTMVMPELIPVTYAKLRAELAAEVASGSRATDLVMVDDRKRVLVDGAGRIGTIVLNQAAPFAAPLAAALATLLADDEVTVTLGQT